MHVLYSEDEMKRGNVIIIGIESKGWQFYSIQKNA